MRLQTLLKRVARATALGGQQAVREAAWSVAGAPPLLVIAYHTSNWGDAANADLVRILSESSPTMIDPVHQLPLLRAKHRRRYHLVMGSTLAFADAQTIVWGPGFLSASARPADRPLEIRAVRGPLSAARLEALGLRCPSVFGDPALLLPRFVKPRPRERQQLGIIPHYVDMRHPALSVLQQRHGAKVINIRGAFRQVIDDIANCDWIVSTSLHGLILADAYGVPNCWAELTGRLAGDGFKFQDYYASIGRMEPEPLRLTGQESAAELIDRCWAPKLNIDLDLLLQQCPFAAPAHASVASCTA